MTVEVRRMSPLDFCIIVLWMHGTTIGKIHKMIAKRHGRTEHAVRGVINKLSKRRADMLRDDRQKFLDQMKVARLDDGMLPAEYFVAKPIASDAKKKSIGPVARKQKAPAVQEPEPDPRTRAGKKEIKRRAAEAAKKQAQELEEKARREAGLAPRGVLAAPLEYLFERGWLGDPGELQAGALGKANNAMRRREAGERLRSMLVSAYSSGLKSQDFESVGGGSGKGIVIHAVVAENLANIEKIKIMLTREEFRQLDSVLRLDCFVWQLPSKRGEQILLEDIRRGLDTVSVFLDFLPPEEFAARWGSVPNVTKRANRDDIRDANYRARDMIAAAQRKVR